MSTRTARPILRRTVVLGAIIAILVGVLTIGMVVSRAGALLTDGGFLSPSGHHPGDAAGGPSDGGPPDADDGVLPDGVTVWDDGYPGVANLDPALVDALRSAAADAELDGIRFVVNSGWRSSALQEQLLQEAEATYGSREEAERWVATPETSQHVSGDAADIGSWDASRWLADHGAAYGLCPVYENEPWHVELRPEAISEGCPPVYRDPTEDPRMQP